MKFSCDWEGEIDEETSCGVKIEKMFKWYCERAIRKN